MERFGGEFGEFFGWEDVSEIGPGELYPFMFVTPSGDLLFAGAETASETQSSVLYRQDDTGQWEVLDGQIPSTVRGGSAVMYEPGRVMKSGGGSRVRCARVDGPPLWARIS